MLFVLRLGNYEPHLYYWREWTILRQAAGHRKATRKNGSSIACDFIALVFNKLAYHGFIAMLSNRAYKRTGRPEFATLQLFLDLRATPEYLAPSSFLIFSRSLSPCKSVSTEWENARDLCPCLSPKTSFTSVPQFPNPPFSKLHQPCFCFGAKPRCAGFRWCLKWWSCIPF